MARGKFITFEGGEGAGKSTQVGLLARTLEAKGMDVLTTREPGGTEGAEEIRDLLLNGDLERWHGKTEALLHFAARVEHLDKTIFPALEAGVWVICDRFTDSTMAYQGYGHCLDINCLARLQEFAIADASPDLTLLLDLKVEDGLARAFARHGNEDRYERRDADFHRRIRKGFLRIAENEPERVRVIDAADDVDSVHRTVKAAVRERFEVSL